MVVATRNRAARLRALLDSLAAQTLPSERFEVVVCDDASTDDTPAVLAEQRPLALRAVRHPVAGGPARARNSAAAVTGGRLIAFIDDDCVAQPGWLQAMVDAWGGDPRRIVQGPVGPSPSERHRLGAFSYTIVVDGPTKNFECANVCYPRALFERLGGFDESYRLTGEDCDLGWRALAAGAEHRFAPAAHVHHAVVQLGASGYLRRLWSWSDAMRPYADHPELRRHLHAGVFWNLSHLLLTRAALGLLLARHRWAWPLAAWLGRWYLAYQIAESRAHAGTPWLAPWWVVRDVVEMAACVRGAVRYRVLVL